MGTEFVGPPCSHCGVAHPSFVHCQGVPPGIIRPTGQKAPPAGPECSCGRQVDREGIKTLQRGVERLVFYRCIDCGREWTQRLPDGVDRGTAVSADEVIDVHQALECYDGPLSGLAKT